MWRSDRTRTSSPRTNAIRPLAVLCALAVLAALAGCGGSNVRPGEASTTSKAPARGSRPTRTTAPSEPLPSVAIGVTVPGLLAGDTLRGLYTCDGRDISPPVRWTGIPRSTAELALFVIDFQPVHGRFFLGWAVAGLSPSSHGIAAGALPSGAAVGRNSFGEAGYSICPPRGRRESYAVKVIALSHRIGVKPGFDAMVLYRQAVQTAKVVGFAGVSYARP
jgi:phosphatidylethanolamine-binding protein (PEBP) family uncharacterized protein